jgi:Arc/MetJ family transcription regulator
MASSFVKKTIELDVDLVKRVREIFDVSTDKEAVNRALQLVASEEGLIDT